MKKNIQVFLLILFFLYSGKQLKAQYNINKGDTIFFTNDFFMFVKSNGNDINYTFFTSDFNSQFEKVYVRNYITQMDNYNLKIVNNDEINNLIIYSADSKYKINDILLHFANAKKITKYNSSIFSEEQKQNFLTNQKIK